MTKETFSINFEDKIHVIHFPDIHLYYDLKQLLGRMLASKESVHTAGQLIQNLSL